jgi:hypothetical protein
MELESNALGGTIGYSFVAIVRFIEAFIVNKRKNGLMHTFLTANQNDECIR